ncbi:hypothetical protein, partial [Staphylococcus pseudintermedius]|uniref:hypothetical protein n=1 Tax=Staphylococcus pseudintermedius TaxID=283734 RepID=UPI000D949AEC
TLMRKIGLTGINESVQKTKNYENNKLEQKFTELRNKAMNGVKQDYLNNRDMGQSIDKWIAAQGDPASFDREVD